MAIAWGAVNSSAVTEIQVVVTGVSDMGSIIDNFTAVSPPENVPTMPAYAFVMTILGMMLVANRRLRSAARRG